MSDFQEDFDDLLDRAAAGDAGAADRLLLHHRDRLRRMVAARLDARLKPRVDPSDIVQETLVEASRKLPDYLQERPIPFYPWLRQIAWDHLVRLHERHVQTRKRSVHAEVSQAGSLSEASVVQLADRLASSRSGPSTQVIRRELVDRVRANLDRMSPSDREILVMRYLEQLTMAEIAAVLGMSESGVKSRHYRALERLTRLLSHLGDEVRGE